MVKIKVLVGELDDNRAVRVPEGTTVEDAFEEADFSVSANDTVQLLDGTEVDIDDEVIANASYFKVTKMKAGSQ